MRTSARILVAVAVLLLLTGLAALGWWYQGRQQAGAVRTAGTLTVDVTSAADRGPGTLREALFVVAAANGEADVWLKVKSIAPESPLPPLVNPHGVRIRAQQGAEIDAHALSGGPVLDVAGANTSVEGVHLRNCPGAGIVLRASGFRLRSSTIEACDVGVDVAENASDILLEGNRFSGDRIGVRFAASNHNGLVAGNTFSASHDAGVWAVRAEPDARSSAITLRENHFDGGRSGVVAANIALTVERNEFSANSESAVHLLGAGAVVRGNHVSGGPGMGIVAENASESVIDDNELDHLGAYGIMVRGSASMLVRGNRVHNCGYGMAFVLGQPHRPSTAVDNTIIAPQFNGIDVVGDSPILRNNKVLQPRAYALHVVDFEPPGGVKVSAHPALENNNFRANSPPAAAEAAAGPARQP